MQVKINITTNNAAFADGNLDAELSRIFKQLSVDTNNKGIRNIFKIQDMNGNTVGSVRVTK